MSQSAREFFRDRVAGTLDTEKFARAQRQALLRDADDEGISEGEMEEAFGGDLHAAMSKAIANGNQG